jgi:hypothetical protein
VIHRCLFPNGVSLGEQMDIEDVLYVDVSFPTSLLLLLLTSVTVRRGLPRVPPALL